MIKLSTIKKRRKTILVVMLCVLAICVSIVTICNYLVVNNAKGRVYDDANNIPKSKVGLLLGTSPISRMSGKTNYFFAYRIDAAERLYKSGRIDMLLISGDEHSYEGADEPQSMKDSLVRRGIPEDKIILDEKGFSTQESISRANKVFRLKSFTIISQEFQNERALYLADHMNLDMKEVIAYNAQAPGNGRVILTYIREYLARVKLIFYTIPITSK